MSSEAEQSVRAGSRAQTPEPDSEISLLDLALFVERQWPWILTPAVVALLATWLVMTFVTPPRFTSSALLLVVAPEVKSEIMPAALDLRDYQTLLESDEILEQTRSILVGQGVLAPDAELVLGEDLSSSVVAPGSDSLARMLRLRGHASAPDRAAAIANAWAEVFLRVSGELEERTTGSVVQFLTDQQPRSQQELEAREAELVSLGNEFQHRHDELANSWDRRIAEQKKKTADLISEFQRQTREQMYGILDGASGAMHPSAEDRGAAAELESLLLELASLRTRLAETERVTVLKKPVSDEVLWESLLDPSSDADTRLGRLPEEILISEELNPAFDNLVGQTIRLEGVVLRCEGADQGRAATLIAAMEDLQRRRSASLAKLKLERQLGLEIMQRERNRELGTIERERSTRLGQLRRQVGILSEFDSRLSRDFGSSLLTMAQEEVRGVTMATRAGPVGRPESRGTLWKSLVAAVIGATLGLLVALYRDAIREAPAPT